MEKELLVGGKYVAVVGEPTAENLFVLPSGREELSFLSEILRTLEERTEGQRCLIAAFDVGDWNDRLSPWCAPAVFGKEDFGQGAEQTLCYIENELLPTLGRHFPCEGRRVFLVGYSLAGLFSLWAVTRTDRFEGAAGVSPSVWFPGWLSYAETHPPRCRVLYLSLGDREEKTKNVTLATVGDAIRQQHALYSGVLPCVLEWNEGNHFVDAGKRLARAMTWLSLTDERLKYNENS